MNSSNNFKQILIWILFVASQILFAQNFVLYNRAFCFVYVGFLLLLPLGISRNNILLLGFLTGFIIDVFYNSLGTHMAAMTLIAFLRPIWLNAITPRGGYENVESPAVKDLSLSWFLAYAMPLLFLHLAVVFFIEAGGFHMFFYVISKVFMSTLLTVFVLVILQYLFYSKGRFS
ncbi:rod shape-determining protein MreD [Marivirga sericea]|uniref:Rod shape-determining protein MreD n=1 Tax=Marivirga sericea TaxID=1028 RepID=A0A1X7KRS4_9BACT|nr:hypothetical protein [Marivirga sericea]SMG44245.1 rod shape-determining protein MreD [Marivirga sericea]